MAHTYNYLVSWLAPILSFTAEEAWSHRPAGVFEEAESVHLREFPSVPESWNNPSLAEKWEQIRKIREPVFYNLEKMRQDKFIGSSLEAEIEISVGPDKKHFFENVDIAEICIVSNANLKIDPELIDKESDNFGARKTHGEKCLRCWKVLPEVSDHADHICNRCNAVVNKKQAA